MDDVWHVSDCQETTRDTPTARTDTTERSTSSLSLSIISELMPSLGLIYIPGIPVGTSIEGNTFPGTVIDLKIQLSCVFPCR
jgi:hypothetical protein